jgi:hypothetical protein
MGGSYRTKAKLFLDLTRTKHETSIREMETVYSSDPTPALRQKIESRRKLLGKLEAEHERFERLMAISDSELKVINSNQRTGPFLGVPELVSKIAKRSMDEAEYTDLTEGPTLIVKRKD